MFALKLDCLEESHFVPVLASQGVLCVLLASPERGSANVPGAWVAADEQPVLVTVVYHVPKYFEYNKVCQKFDDNLRAATGVVGIPSISGGITFVIIVAVIAVLAALASFVDNLHLLGVRVRDVRDGPGLLHALHLHEDAVDRGAGLDTGTGHDQDQHCCRII